MNFYWTMLSLSGNNFIYYCFIWCVGALIVWEILEVFPRIQLHNLSKPSIQIYSVLKNIIAAHINPVHPLYSIGHICTLRDEHLNPNSLWDQLLWGMRWYKSLEYYNKGENVILGCSPFQQKVQNFEGRCKSGFTLECFKLKTK